MITSAVLNHLWQSTLFAIGAGLLSLLFRRRRARVRYAIWLAASLKFLLPFSFLIAAGGSIRWQAPASDRSYSAAIEQVGEPFTTVAPSAASIMPAHAPSSIPVAVWAAGFMVYSLVWFLRWVRIRSEVRAASLVGFEGTVPILSSPALYEPSVFGLVGPVLVLPAGIQERLSAAELSAILAHEMGHIRNRDNLTAALHMCAQAIFWFHPLMWWIGSRLIEERERACDEEVLSGGVEPQVYAESILKSCRFYLAMRLACVAGMSGSNLKQRIGRIMSNEPAAKLGASRKLFLGIALFAATAGPFTLGLLNAAPRATQAALAKSEAKPSAAATPSAATSTDTFTDAQLVSGASPDTAGLPWETLAEPLRLEASAHIDARGRVTTVKILRFDQDSPIARVAILALKQWKFRPATVNSRPVDCDRHIVLMLHPSAGKSAQNHTPEAPPERDYVAPKVVRQMFPQLSGSMKPAAGSPLWVHVDAEIDTAGRVSAAHARDFDPDSAFGMAVVSAVRQWTFEPARLNGTPVSSHHTIVFQFRAGDNESQ